MTAVHEPPLSPEERLLHLSVSDDPAEHRRAVRIAEGMVARRKAGRHWRETWDWFRWATLLPAIPHAG